MIGTIRTKQTLTLYTIAGEDQSALAFPLPDRLFGFCAQQSLEKLFKALIAAHGQAFSFTHNLSDLIDQLERECGETLPITPYPIDELQPFAVQLRYEVATSLSEDARAQIRETVAILRAHIYERILKAEKAILP